MSSIEAPTSRAPAGEEEGLLSWREEVPILESSSYLISNSLGAMPRGVRAALAGYADTWATRGVGAWEEEWWLLPEEVGNAIGSIIGAPPGTVSTHQNVTLASAVLASCFDFSSERNRIVCSELNFPSIVQMYRGYERHGAQLHLVASPDGFEVPTAAMIAAIDERTALVPISHVIFRGSYLQDVEAIIARAREVGASVALDIYQSAGVMPIDVTGLDVDFAVGGVLKWLCGGPGVAYLYTRADLMAELEPALTGWCARREPFAFDPHDTTYRDDARRFLNGTTDIPSLSAAVPGLDIIGRLDLASVRRKSHRQTQLIIAAASERGWCVNSPLSTERRGGHVTVNVPDADRVAQQLMQRRIMVDYRPGAGIRMAPHFYTTDAEIEHALAAIDELTRQ